MFNALRSVLLLVGLTSIGCSDTEFNVVRVPGYSARELPVSVLGVFRNGRMDADAWEEWKQTVASAFGGRGAPIETCQPAFDVRLEKAAPDLFAAVDASTRDDGITDEILDKIGEKAQGDAILVIETFGRPPPRKSAPEVTHSPAPATPPQRSTGRGRRRAQAPAETETPSEPPPSKLEVSISLYSLKTRQVIASVGVTYAGDGAKDALREFSGKLKATFDGARCAGWAWQRAGETSATLVDSDTEARPN